MLVTSILLIASSAFTQGNFYQRVTKDMEQRDKEKKSLTKEEQKLSCGLLVTMLQMAEKADSSDSIKQEFKKRVNEYERNKVDSKDRIHIIIVLRSIADIGNMVTKIQSLDGIVEEQGETVEYVVCKIHPKKLRDLILDNSVNRITDVPTSVRVR